MIREPVDAQSSQRAKETSEAVEGLPPSVELAELTVPVQIHFAPAWRNPNQAGGRRGTMSLLFTQRMCWIRQ